MSQLAALSLSIAVLGGLATWVFLLVGGILIWAALNLKSLLSVAFDNALISLLAQSSAISQARLQCPHHNRLGLRVPILRDDTKAEQRCSASTQKMGRSRAPFCCLVATIFSRAVRLCPHQSCPRVIRGLA
jgi:hypothetical protein